MKNTNKKVGALIKLSLKDSEARYRGLFEAAQDGILILDARTGMIEDVNPHLIKMLGYSPEEFIKKRLWEVGAFKDIEASQKAFKALQENEYIRYEDLPLKTKDGQLIQVEFVSNVYMVGSEKVIQCDIRDITDHKRIIDELKENEKKYHDLINQSPDGIFLIGLSGKILSVNKIMCSELAYSGEELLSMKIWDIIPRQYLGQHRKRLTKILEGKSLEEPAEYVLRGKDGKTHYVEILSAPHYSGKEIIGFQGIARDITKRKRVEQLMETLNIASLEAERASSHEDIFDALQRELKKLDFSCMIFSVNENENVLLPKYLGYPAGVLAALEKLTGITRDEFKLSIDDSDLYRRVVCEQEICFVTDLTVVLNQILPKRLEKFARAIIKLLNISQMISAPVIVDGKVIAVFSVQSKTLTEKDTPIIAAFANQIAATWHKAELFEQAQQEIAQRKQAEETLRLSEEKYRMLVDEVNDGFYESDGAGVFTFVNPALARMYGVGSLEALTGRKFYDFLMPELPAVLDEAYSSSMQTGRAPDFIKGQIMRPDGTHVFIEVKPSMIVKEGQIVGTRGVVRDITERKQAEDKILRQLAHLTALSAIDRFTAANFDLKLGLSEILRHVTIELGIDAADILILDSNLPLLNYGAERGFRSKAVRKAQIHLGKSLAGRVVLERKLVQIPNLRDEPDNLFLKTLLTDEEFECYFGVPLIFKGQVNGVLEIFHRAAFEPDAEWLDFLNALAGQAAIAIENATLFEGLQRSNLELTLAYDETIEGWSQAMDLRDKETEGHTQRVTVITVKLALISGLKEADLVQVRMGALLHDIGKIGVPDEILLKPGLLTDEEWVKMKKHPTFAYEMLSPIRYLRLALDIPYCHHEKWDGTGYPRGLKGEQIPLVARIFAVVDVWDALTSDRPYRAAWPEEKVLDHIRTLAGTHFDPQVVKICLESGLLKGQKRP